MNNVTLSDWTALYAAILSTLLTLATFFRWILGGPRLGVTVFNPAEASYNGALLAIVSNVGAVPVVVQQLTISFRASRWPWGDEIGKAIFDEKSRWKPSVKIVPTPGKINISHEEPNIINPGEEIRAPAMPIKEFDVNKHWIRVVAIPRSSRRKFVGWASPAPSSPNSGEQP